MAKVHVFIVFKLMTASDFLCSRELFKFKFKKIKKNEKEKFGVVHGRWSMEGVHRVVHGRGPRGSPWTGGQCFQLFPGKITSKV